MPIGKTPTGGKQVGWFCVGANDRGTKPGYAFFLKTAEEKPLLPLDFRGQQAEGVPGEGAFCRLWRTRLYFPRRAGKVGVHAMQKTYILNQNRDFLQLYRRGKKFVSPYVVIYVRKTRRRYNRLGITVGKKVGGAVQRNRARRIIRQAYRETESMFPTGLDLVIVALPSIVGISSTKLRDYLAGSGLSRIRRWMEPPSEGGKPD